MTDGRERQPRPAVDGILLPVILAALLIPVLIWSWIAPHDRMTWWLEAAPVFAVVPILALTRRTFPLTPLLYAAVWVHCVVLLVGAHYTYALVPAGDWVRDALDLGRNHYDRLGHFLQGAVPALAARELLLRLTPIRPGGWLFAIVVLSVLGISAGYELIEWIAAEALESNADSFLGQQGDVWDTQKDMAMALIGASLAQWFLAPFQNRQLSRIGTDL